MGESAATVAGAWAIACALQAHGQSPFASRVVSFDPAPGQHVNTAAFNDPLRALGPPVGGGVGAADNSKVVSLGGFGGSITLGFEVPVQNLPPTPGNPAGADLIVFGNAFWVGGNAQRRWAEPGVIEVSADVNANGLADDAWYVVTGTHLPMQPVLALHTHTFDSTTTPAAWFPSGHGGGPVVRTSLRLNDPIFLGPSPVLENLSADVQQVRGYADCSPTMVLGDFDGDGTTDDQEADAAWFYTIASNPASLGIPHFCGGGEPVRLEDAVLMNGQPAVLSAIDFVRITTATSVVRGVFGESSTDVCGVAAVRARSPADIGRQGGRLGPDGLLDNNDFVVFIDLFFAQRSLADLGSQGGVPGADGQFDNNDFVVFITRFFEGA